MELFNACKYMFSQQAYSGMQTAYQPMMNYQPQYMGQPQPQVIIIQKGGSNTKPQTYNPYNQHR